MRNVCFTVMAGLLCGTAVAQAAQPAWIAVSDSYTKKVLDVEMKHHPEIGSEQGLSQFDTLVSQPTLADEQAARREKEALVKELKAALGEQKDKSVAQDLQITIRKQELGFRQQDFAMAHDIPFLNASGIVFGGLHILLDEHVFSDGSRPPNLIFRPSDILLLEIWARNTKAAKVLKMPRR